MLTYKTICLKCNTEYVPLKNGVYVCEVADFGPYKIWHADIIYCPVCKDTVISGLGADAILEHWENGFKTYLKEVSFFFGYNAQSREVARKLQAEVGEPSDIIGKIIIKMENIMKGE